MKYDVKTQEEDFQRAKVMGQIQRFRICRYLLLGEAEVWWDFSTIQNLLEKRKADSLRSDDIITNHPQSVICLYM